MKHLANRKEKKNSKTLNKLSSFHPRILGMTGQSTKWRDWRCLKRENTWHSSTTFKFKSQLTNWLPYKAIRLLVFQITLYCLQQPNECQPHRAIHWVREKTKTDPEWRWIAMHLLGSTVMCCSLTAPSNIRNRKWNRQTEEQEEDDRVEACCFIAKSCLVCCWVWRWMDADPGKARHYAIPSTERAPILQITTPPLPVVVLLDNPTQKNLNEADQQ